MGAIVKRFSDLSSRRRMVAGNDMQPISVARLWCSSAGQHRKLDGASENFRVRPSWQCVPLVAAHDPKQPCAGKTLGHFLRRPVGKRCTRLGELKIIGHRPRQLSSR